MRTLLSIQSKEETRPFGSSWYASMPLIAATFLQDVGRDKLQLVAVACILVAAKQEEVSHRKPLLDTTTWWHCTQDSLAACLLQLEPATDPSTSLQPAIATSS